MFSSSQMMLEADLLTIFDFQGQIFSSSSYVTIWKGISVERDYYFIQFTEG